MTSVALPSSAVDVPRPRFIKRLWRGPETDPAWARPALIALLVVTALAYIWDLSASGWANSFYAAAVQAGGESWKALFFGCSDMACSITVDKPPASLWVMGLSAKLFGFSSWSMIIPQALMGVATVGVLYASIKRWCNVHAALIAAGVMALTPIAALMFRFNNPDALLVMLMVLAVYATVRAIEKGSTWWMVAAGAFLGFAFLTKMIQAFLVIPALGLAFLIAAPTPLLKRVWSSCAALIALVVSAGWYIAIVELIPAANRPFIGGSTNNSLLELALGYNGVERISGDGVGGGGGGMGGGNPGIGRLFGSDMGGQIAWLLPAALIFMVVGFAVTMRRPRTDRMRALFIIWGGWLVVTGVVFSMMNGVIHAYYTVALAPAIAALVGMGASLLWQRRSEFWARCVFATAIFATTITSIVLLMRASGWNTWLIPIIAVAGVAGAVGALLSDQLSEILRTGTIALIAVGCLLGPAAFTVQTIATAHSGSIVSAGPSSGGMGGGPGGAMNAMNGTPPGMNDGTSQGFSNSENSRGGMGGMNFLNAQTTDSELVQVLTQDAQKYTWIAATTGANSAAGIQLTTGYSVMPIGGFNGSDDSPTLEQFKQYVSDGLIHYYISGGGTGGKPGASGVGSASQIQSWVTENFTATTVGNTTVYDLTQQ